MTKTLTLVVLPVLVVTLAGCLPQGATPTPTPTATEETTQNQDQGTGVSLTQMAAGLVPGAAYTCTFESVDNSQTMNYIIQDKKVSMSMESTTAGNPQSRFITDGEMVYIWDPETKKGTKMKMMTPEEMQQLAGQSNQLPTPQLPDFSDPDSLAEVEQNYRTSCSPTIVTGAEFVPPTDVEFQDMSALMEMMKKYQAPQ